jgi:hypothetical protein
VVILILIYTILPEQGKQKMKELKQEIDSITPELLK